MSSTGKITFLYLLSSTRPIIITTAGHERCGIEGRLSQPGLLQEAKEAFDFRCGTEWFRVALIKTLVSRELLTFLPTRAGARCHVRHAR